MQTTLAILLYLGFISSPGTYNESYINDLENVHEYEILAVYNDPEQMETVENDYLPQSEKIIVINDGEVGS
ncbi:MAG: hypothetical protein M3Q97_02045, partial [Bacteroidota bacterium]|nr:hypothetical protein [Bacteroidota bacterium]